jgi:hypothetical protein
MRHGNQRHKCHVGTAALSFGMAAADTGNHERSAPTSDWAGVARFGWQPISPGTVAHIDDL